jgi:hypothetical protein
MRRHYAELKGLLVLLHIFMTLSENRPRGSCARFDPNDLEHNSDCLGQISIDIRLVCIPKQRSYFKR